MKTQTPHPTFSGNFTLEERFPIPNLEDWENLAVSSLKGRSLEKLESLLPEGFRTRVLYAAENSPVPDPGEPGASPYLRGSSTSAASWLSCPLIDAADPARAGNEVSFAVGRDARALWLRLSDHWDWEQGGIILRAAEDFDILLEGVDLSEIEIHLDGGASALRFALGLIAWCRRRGVPRDKLRGSFGIDPIGVLARRGSLPGGVRAQMESLSAMVGWSLKHCSGMRCLSLSSLPFQEAGASAVEELGILLAGAAEILRGLESSGISPEKGLRSLLFRLAIGRDFFTGIAKLRALRALSSLFERHCGLSECTPPPIHAVTSFRSLSRRDPWVNLLRQTVESFAAVAGGAEILTTRAFDSLQGEAGELGRRMALNTQTILREECHLDRITDPAGGSWYVEDLSRELADGGWEYFRSIEAEGGLLRSLKDGLIQERLGNKAAWIRKQIAHRKMPVTGVSTWAKIGEEIPSQRKLVKAQTSDPVDFDLCKLSDEGVIEEALEAAEQDFDRLGWHKEGPEKISALERFREAEDFEALQDRAAQLAQLGCDTSFLLLKLGPNSETSARESFIVNFFAAGGIGSRSLGGFETVGECMEALKGVQKPNICIVGADSRYPEILPDLLPALKKAGARRICMAGRPGDAEEKWRSAGIEAFIHVGMDVLAFLGEVLDTMEVES